MDGMTRPLRIDIEDGWYHITSRGLERRAIYGDEKDSKHFKELLEEMVERYGIKIHAYVLMGNHYHLLIQTPHANTSKAIQWLNVSYSIWFNLKYDRSGPLFQGRFKSILVEEEGAWALEASTYIHLNPVRVKGLGLGKQKSKAERKGMAVPTDGQVMERLKTLRGYEWSSYWAYAGYCDKPGWLTCDEIWRRAAGRRSEDKRKTYREYLEGYLRQDREEGLKERIKVALAIGSQKFREKMRGIVKGNGKEQPDVRKWQRLLPFERVISVVEAKKSGAWQEFRDKKSDWGRDLALWLGRRHCGLSLKELGEAVGGMEYAAVSKAVTRMGERLKEDRKLRKIAKSAESDMSNV